MQKPLIGYITTPNDPYPDMTLAYHKAIEAAGGLAVPIRWEDTVRAEEVLKTLSGLLITGGADVDPSLYGVEPLPQCGALCPERDEMDAVFFRTAYRKHMPILGICRGMQMINVLLGGTLYQDLPTDRPENGPVDHSRVDAVHSPVHRVTFPAKTLLREIYGAEGAYVNSTHHQAVRTLATPLQPAAIAEDGLIEGYVDTTYPYLIGVQFHPELLPALSAIFDDFVRAARLYDPEKPELLCRKRHYAEANPVPVLRVGVEDTFGCSGKVPALLEKFGLTPANLAAKAKAAVALKK